MTRRPKPVDPWADVELNTWPEDAATAQPDPCPHTERRTRHVPAEFTRQHGRVPAHDVWVCQECGGILGRVQGDREAS